MNLAAVKHLKRSTPKGTISFISTGRMRNFPASIAIPANTAAPRMPGGLAPAAETAIATPPNWEPQPLSQMRQASFLVKGDNGAVADISFVSLGAGAGNVLDNVNRWLDQLGQPPIT